jgi:hypothetical protein
MLGEVVRQVLFLYLQRWCPDARLSVVQEDREIDEEREEGRGKGELTWSRF